LAISNSTEGEFRSGHGKTGLWRDGEIKIAAPFTGGQAALLGRPR
jgi:hypothetical protein